MINTTTIPSTVKVDDNTIKTDTDGTIYAVYDPSAISLSGQNLIRSLISGAVTFGARGDCFAEAFIDADGRNNSVDTGNSNALFLTDAYYSVRANFITRSGGNSGSGTSKRGMKFTYTGTGCTAIIAKKYSSCTATKAYLCNSAVSILQTVDFSGDYATFNYTLVTGTTYYILVDKAGASYTQIGGGGTYPQVKDDFTFTSAWNTIDQDTDQFELEYLYAPVERNIILTLPSGTTTATIKKSIGVAMLKTYETGADIQYKLYNAGTNDSGFLPCGVLPTPSSFTQFTSEATKVNIKLIPKTGGGILAIKGFMIKEI